MDTKIADERWLQALGLLYQACEPLTHDCILYADDIKTQRENIAHQTFYCMHVKGAIEDGITPLSYDEWDNRAQAFEVNASVSVAPGMSVEPEPEPEPEQEEISEEQSRFIRVAKIAAQMVERGMISAEQVQTQVEEGLKWNDDAIKMMENVISKIPIPTVANRVERTVQQQLNEAFGGEYDTKTPNKERAKTGGFAEKQPIFYDDVRMTASYGRRDE